MVSKPVSQTFQWEGNDSTLAPLSILQRNSVLDLYHDVQEELSYHDVVSVKPESSIASKTSDCDVQKDPEPLHPVETTHEFLTCYSEIESKWIHSGGKEYANCLALLNDRKLRCSQLFTKIAASLDYLSQLSDEYKLASMKTDSLHRVSEQLLTNQLKLCHIDESVVERLVNFKKLDELAHILDSPTASPSIDAFGEVLDQLDQRLTYLHAHRNFKQSCNYVARYEHCLRRALAQLKTSIFDGLASASQQATSVSISDASHYARFQSAGHRAKAAVALLEARTNSSPLYENVLAECQSQYVFEREGLIGSSVTSMVASLSTTHAADHCSLIRAASVFLIHVSQDEFRLYSHFFAQPSPIFTSYLESLCLCLYDTMRPLVIHMKHLESLTELCSILRQEMIQEYVQHNTAALEAFGRVAEQLLHDVQERLVFRALLYLKTDIAEYKPAPGDLAYPEKLEMMQSIAQSLQSLPSAMSRSESQSSLLSIGSTTSQEVARINNPPIATTPLLTSSPADVHGLWYPPVRRTLICLSRLYRCLEKPIFQGLSQEALAFCIQSIKQAALQISANKSPLDGEMFQIKHLLILREQIAPFQVDFAIKEMSLDFSMMKTAAVGLLQKRTRLFTLNSSNALLELLVSGPAVVREQWIDSRKDVDQQLKESCEAFIGHASRLLTAPLEAFLNKVDQFEKREEVHKEAWASASAMAAVVQETCRAIKANLPGLQHTMQLYLANKDTEFILYRPIKNNVIGRFMKLLQLLNEPGVSEEVRLLVGCPTAEQVSVVLSSASLVSKWQTNN